MKYITVDILDRNSVQNAVAELKAVKQEWERKAKQAEEAIAQELARLIEANLSAIPYSDDIVDIGTHQETPGILMYGVEVNGSSVTVKGGDNSELAFIEFGAGVYHNGGGQQNPLASEVSFDTAIGSYGNGNGLKPYWFIKHNTISRGTPAYMPIWLALVEIREKAPTIVRGIFV